ncbi:hypothetical protein Rhopal_006470-T1 [Rhodotorula paludigena]|uniref:Paladin n=1 Tax=Rhodotorula paludigena TaxID=86838 RepID=A0AAV5GU27_9BASI|nr:hypothetical protein Rhopal_006470-T1 [Rhodotorula paludigena]
MPDSGDSPTAHSKRRTSLPLGRPLGAFLDSTPASSPTVQHGGFNLNAGQRPAQSPLLARRQQTRPDSPHRRNSSDVPAPPLGSLLDRSASAQGTADDDSDVLPAAPLNLARLAAGVVPSRHGSVLSRGLILKSDYRFAAQPPSSASSPTAANNSAQATSAAHDPGSDPGTAATGGEAGLNVTGATNLREGGLGVWGVAQPTATGVRSLLSLLRSKEGGKGDKGREVAWFVTREEPILYIGGQPYVLREAAHPTETYSISNRVENLEEIETRLKDDVLREASRYGGLVLIHSEPYSGPIHPSWVSVSPSSVLTAAELFAEISSEGYNVMYHRTPVARDQSPMDGYLDAYTDRLRRIPTSTALVFNCGAGVVRSTFAMSVALLVRRRMLIEHGRKDPFAEVVDDDGGASGAKSPGSGDGARDAAMRVIRMQSEQARRDRSLLRLMHVLSKSLPTRSQTTILGILSSQSTLLENLRSALLGNFDIILSLLSCLDDGSQVKKVVDAVVDSCDAMVNLRESIVQYRVRYASLALLDERTAAAYRQSALAALERYFFLLAFGAFISDTSSPSPVLPSSPSSRETPTEHVTFSTWLKRRSEIAKMLGRLRKSTPGHFYVFAPVQDLSAIAKADRLGESVVVASRKLKGDAAAGGEMVGDEWAQQIIRARSGIILRPNLILKLDQWLSTSPDSKPLIRGATNFRRISDAVADAPTFLYGLSQPTEEGIRAVLQRVKGDLGVDGHDGVKDKKIVWIGVREEPLVNINGISSSRLELLESRLKSDVLSELETFEGRILVATETDDGSVNPVWETVEDGEEQIKTMREMMDAVGHAECGEAFRFIRVPITAEKFPEFSDLRDIIEVVTELDMDSSAILVNDQLGRGRTTRTLVIIKLLQDWLRHGGKHHAPKSSRPSFAIINNLLRVIRNGFEVKNAVDAAVTACGEPFDLLEAVENARQQALDSEGETRDKWIARGVRELRAYFFLILFRAFLNESRPETWRDLGRTASYEDFVRQRPVFRTIEKELDEAGLDALTPLTQSAISSGTASNDEIADFVAHRSGRILSAYTVVKSDFFSGLQKMALPERVDGSPNFRRVPLSIAGSEAALRTPISTASAQAQQQSGPLVYGTGMPTVDGLRRALEKMGARDTLILWQSLREEPVVFVSGRPHVLRLFDRPLENVVTTGVTTATVEAMEVELKKDLLREREGTGGKVLLHDEIEENGNFTVTAMWEEVKAKDILTPREVYTIMQKEGFKVDYDRLPVTDEQAPIPGIFSRIERRLSSALTGHDKENFSAAWNCQMGRGRTTTGMVACALVYRILFNRQAAFDMSSSYIEPEQGHNLHWDGREAEPLLQGEYKLVLQLVGVLKHGKLAKRLTDRAIDDMEAVQNLRTAIYSFKLRVEAAEENSKKRRTLFHQALNYLYRYATLIVFANFLLDKASHLFDAEDSDASDSKKTRDFPSFEQYLSERYEINQILSRRTLE